MLLFNISFIIPCCLLLVAFLYGISSRKLRDNQQTRRYLLYLGFFLSTELVRLTASYILNIKLADYLYLFYVAGEFLLLLYFFHKVLKLSKVWKTAIALIASCFFIETVIMLLAFGDPNIGFSKSISHVIIVITVAFTLVKNLKELEEKNPFLPLYTALFFYYAASIFLFPIMHQLTKSTIHVWSIHNLMSCILYVSSIYTFYQLRKLY